MASTETFTVIVHQSQEEEDVLSGVNDATEDGESSPKKRKFGPEEFHNGLWYLN